MKSGSYFLDQENFLKLHFNVQNILFGEKKWASRIQEILSVENIDIMWLQSILLENSIVILEPINTDFPKKPEPLTFVLQIYQNPQMWERLFEINSQVTNEVIYELYPSNSIGNKSVDLNVENYMLEGEGEEALENE